jgi:hypothetical protein
MPWWFAVAERDHQLESDERGEIAREFPLQPSGSLAETAERFAAADVRLETIIPAPDELLRQNDVYRDRYLRVERELLGSHHRRSQTP